MSIEILKQAIAHAKTGNKAEAKRLLELVIQQDPNNETAWIWMTDVVETDHERRICLEKVLAINPNNLIAKEGLKHLSTTNVSADSTSRPQSLQSRIAQTSVPTLAATSTEKQDSITSPAQDTPHETKRAPIARTTESQRQPIAQPRINSSRVLQGCLLFVLAAPISCLILNLASTDPGFKGIGYAVIFAIAALIGVYGILSGVGIIRLRPEQIRRLTSGTNAIATLFVFGCGALMILGIVSIVFFVAITAITGRDIKGQSALNPTETEVESSLLRTPSPRDFSDSSSQQTGMSLSSATSVPMATRTPTSVARLITPTFTPAPSRTPTLAPRPTRPANWVCYKRLGGDFEWLRPSAWTLDWEDEDSATFNVNAAQTSQAIFIISDESAIRSDVNSTSLEARASKLTLGPFDKYQRGNNKGTWGDGGYFTEFVLGASIQEGQYIRVFLGVVPSGRKLVSFLFFHRGQSAFTPGETSIFNQIPAYLGDCR